MATWRVAQAVQGSNILVGRLIVADELIVNGGVLVFLRGEGKDEKVYAVVRDYIMCTRLEEGCASP